MHFVVTRDDQASFSVAKCASHLKGGATSVTADLYV